jgi:hypothetical protein
MIIVNIVFDTAVYKYALALDFLVFFSLWIFNWAIVGFTGISGTT